MAPLWPRRRSGQLRTTPPHSCRGSAPVQTRPSAQPHLPVGRRPTPRQPLDPAAFGLNRATSQSVGASFPAASSERLVRAGRGGRQYSESSRAPFLLVMYTSVSIKSMVKSKCNFEWDKWTAVAHSSRKSLDLATKYLL